MAAKCARPADLGKRIHERAAAILEMNRRHLALDWLKEYALPQLREACGRIAQELPGDAAKGLHVQRELIRNPAFARYLARLLPLLPEEEPPEPAQPVLRREPVCPQGRTHIPDRADVLAGRLHKGLPGQREGPHRIQSTGRGSGAGHRRPGRLGAALLSGKLRAHGAGP